MTQYNENISYEILENGYKIYLDGRIWIEQLDEYSKPYDKDKTYEENCLLQLADITAPHTPVATPEEMQVKIDALEKELTSSELALTGQYEQNLALQEEVTNTQLALTEVYEMLG